MTSQSCDEPENTSSTGETPGGEEGNPISQEAGGVESGARRHGDILSDSRRSRGGGGQPDPSEGVTARSA